jgi:hypothetical protein
MDANLTYCEAAALRNVRSANILAALVRCLQNICGPVLSAQVGPLYFAVEQLGFSAWWAA